MVELTTEQIISHLTVLGWWAVMAKTGRGQVLGICNGRQCFYKSRYGRVEDVRVHNKESFREVDWWRMRDDTLRMLMLTVDAQGIGGWGGD